MRVNCKKDPIEPITLLESGMIAIPFKEFQKGIPQKISASCNGSGDLFRCRGKKIERENLKIANKNSFRRTLLSFEVFFFLYFINYVMFSFFSVVHQTQVDYILHFLVLFVTLHFSLLTNPLCDLLHGEKNCACSLLCSHSDFRF